MKPIKISKELASREDVCRRVKEMTGKTKYSVGIIREILEAYGDTIVEFLATGKRVPLRGVGTLSLFITPIKPRIYDSNLQKYNFLAETKLKPPLNGKSRLRERILEFYEITESDVRKKLESGNRLPDEE